SATLLTRLTAYAHYGHAFGQGGGEAGPTRTTATSSWCSATEAKPAGSAAPGTRRRPATLPRCGLGERQLDAQVGGPALELRARRAVALERAEEDGEPPLPLEPLAAGGEPPLDVLPLAREEQQHRELGPEDGHARVLEVAVALVDQLGEVGDDARAVAADGRE